MTRYPLTWPAGWRRTKASIRTRARFGSVERQHSTEGTDPQPALRRRREITVAGGAERIVDALRLLSVPRDEVIVSTNLHLRLDGLPRSGQGEPSDPGVAVYWKKRGAPVYKVMAVDRYDRVAGNLAAVAATLEAMRAIDRHGGAEILDRAFTGFIALPAPKDWREILGVSDGMTLPQVKIQYRKLAQLRHPDNGGTPAAMSELNAAWTRAQEELVEA